MLFKISTVFTMSATGISGSATQQVSTLQGCNNKKRQRLKLLPVTHSLTRRTRKSYPGDQISPNALCRKVQNALSPRLFFFSLLLFGSSQKSERTGLASCFAFWRSGSEPETAQVSERVVGVVTPRSSGARHAVSAAWQPDGRRRTFTQL